jgi:cold-inducible RNA-binding protein
MAKKVFVGNLSFQTTDSDLSDLFAQFGEVESVSIITDRDTGRSKGFGFVAMSDDSAEKAISQLNGTELNGRALTVNEARPMVKKDFGGGGGGGRQGGGNNRGGGYGRGGGGGRY